MSTGNELAEVDATSADVSMQGAGMGEALSASGIPAANRMLLRSGVSGLDDVRSRAGEVYDVNRPLLAALIEEAGGSVVSESMMALAVTSSLL